MEKKKPIRMCAICHEKKKKSQLIKVVKVKGGQISVDKLNKLNGRSVYICESEQCLSKAIKSRLIQRTLGDVDDNIYEEIRNVQTARKN